jgi:hypothetical protein
MTLFYFNGLFLLKGENFMNKLIFAAITLGLSIAAYSSDETPVCYNKLTKVCSTEAIGTTGWFKVYVALFNENGTQVNRVLLVDGVNESKALEILKSDSCK